MLSYQKHEQYQQLYVDLRDFNNFIKMRIFKFANIRETQFNVNVLFDFNLKKEFTSNFLIIARFKIMVCYISIK